MKLEPVERWALAVTALFLLLTGGVSLRRRLEAPDFSAEAFAAPAAVERGPGTEGDGIPGPEAQIEIQVSRALPPEAAESPAPEKININTAGPEELEALEGVGPVLAARIVEYREAHGPFAGVEELTGVKGIGPGILERNRDRLTVGEGGAAE